MTFDPKSQVKSFHHLGFVVKDIDRTIDFYVNILGFEVFYRWSETPEQVRGGMGIPNAGLDLVQLKGHGALLEFYTYPDSPGPDTPVVPNHVGAAHAGFLVHDLHAFIKELIELGVQVPNGIVELDTSRWVHIVDPDGIRIEIMEFFAD